MEMTMHKVTFPDTLEGLALEYMVLVELSKMNLDLATREDYADHAIEVSEEIADRVSIDREMLYESIAELNPISPYLLSVLLAAKGEQPTENNEPLFGNLALAADIIRQLLPMTDETGVAPKPTKEQKLDWLTFADHLGPDYLASFRSMANMVHKVNDWK
jgi:hypothetical protein